jgi:hypothetical protein
MKKTVLILINLLFCLSQQIFADDDKKDNQLVIYLESRELQNKLDVSTLQDGEYLVVLEKNGVKTKQKLFVKNEE